jgi:predicted PurR-regulated permease PerM
MNSDQISNNKIRQVFMLAVIIILSAIILYNLSDFLPSLLGAITLYIISRSWNFKLVEEKGWKPWVAALVIILICLVIIVIPTYFTIEVLVNKISDAKAYTESITQFFEKIETYIRAKTGFEILSGGNLEKITGFATQASTAILNTTVNMISVIVGMFFILYFMLTKGRLFERILTSISPLKKANDQKIGEKFRKMVIANAVGIPVVALGQAIIAVIGYFIFGAPSPLLLFILTFIGSMIPIVGAAIIYVPVGLFMLASGDTFGGLGVLGFGFIIVGLVDNIFRFTFLKKLENIHPLNTVFGIILGLKIFGFLGLIFGPILVSITILLMQIYGDEFSEEIEDSPNDIVLPESEKPLQSKIDIDI